MQRSALIWIVLAGLLGLGAWLATRPARSGSAVAPSGQSWLASLDVSAIGRLDVERADGSIAGFARDSSDDSWIMETPAAGAAARRWPADAMRIRAAIRLLADAGSATDASGDGSAAMAGGVTLRLTLKEGVPRTVRIAPAALGGRVMIAIDPPDKGPSTYKLADGGLATVFSSEGLASWRVDRPLASADVSRVLGEQGTKILSLTRLKGQWRIAQPVQAPGDSAGVTQFIGATHETRVLRFLGSPDVGSESSRASTGLATPGLTLSLEQDIASGTERATIRRIIKIGSPASPNASTYFAEIACERVNAEGKSDAMWGPEVVIVDRGVLTSGLPGVEALASKRSCEASAADVTRVRMWGEMSVDAFAGPPPANAPSTAASFVRGLNGWSRDGSTAITPSTGAALDRLVRLLTEESAAEVHASAAKLTPIAWIELSNSSGTVRDVVVIGASAEGKNPASIVVRSGSISRIYTGGVVGLDEFVRDAIASK